MKHQTALFFCLLLISCFEAAAQFENNNWCFGYRTGISFNSGSPVFYQDSIDVFEGSASVSDAAGNLLFYTSGANIWDRNHNLMPNGAGLSGNTTSAANGVAIMQSVSNPDQYYIVTTDEIESGLHNAYYTVVDMSLNGGLGDALPAQSSILLSTDVAEGVRIVPAGDCGSNWIILHRYSTNSYLAFKADASGISSTPVVSPGAAGFPVNVTYGNYGYMQFNNALDRIIRAGGSKMETAAFDRATGNFSGFALINPAPNIAWYACFSPDDNLVYFSSYMNLCQMNISLLPSVTAVQGSILSLGPGSYCGMRLGPDGKIYLINNNTTFISRVNNPNNPGAACNLDPTALTVPPYSLMFANYFFFELGNPATVVHPDTLPGVSSDTLACFTDQLILNGNPTYQAYQWSTGSTDPAITVTEDGVYWLKGVHNCKVYTDTFHVQLTNFTLDLGPDTGICTGHTYLIDATVPGPATYLWQDGSTNATYTAAGAGIYNVTVSKDGCNAHDTISLEIFQPSLHILEPDTVLCKGSPIVLHAIATPGSSFRWSDGSTEDHIQTNGTGIYSVIATSVCGTLSDEVKITEQDCDCIPFVPNAFSPNGDGNNEQFRVRISCNTTQFSMSIYNRYGQRIYWTRSPDEGWDGTFEGKPMDVGTYFYYLRYKGPRGNNFERKGDLSLLR